MAESDGVSPARIAFARLATHCRGARPNQGDWRKSDNQCAGRLCLQRSAARDIHTDRDAERRAAIQRKITITAGKKAQEEITVGGEMGALESITVLGQRTSIVVARQSAIRSAQPGQHHHIRGNTQGTRCQRRGGGAPHSRRFIETDEGEGRYVNCRGLDADLNSTTSAVCVCPPLTMLAFGGYRR